MTGTVGDLHAAYTARFPASAEAARVARDLLPGGIAHDGRAAAPFPLSFERAQGATKRDLDGNDVIDYWMGHGALMLGHGPPVVVEALARQAGLGTHYGGCHPAEARWARAIVDLVPSAERVRFVASGTEATLMALRIARAATGRSRIVRLEGHFHGWHDWVAIGNRPPFDRPSSGGVPPSVGAEVVVVPNDDLAAVERALTGEAAAIILEPGGGTQGRVPTAPELVRELRALATATGTVLVFDEVVSGFRISPGGAQEAIGVVPDLTALAKIVAGGLPGGAVCGRADLMAVLSPSPPAGRERVAHPGTFNANPLSAVAGVATLAAIADGRALDRAAAAAATLRSRLNDLMRQAGVAGFAYGDRSIVHVLLGPAGEAVWLAGGDPTAVPARDLLAIAPELAAGWRTACLYHGLDLMGPTLMVSSAHTAAVVDESMARFEEVFGTMRRYGILPQRATARVA